MHVNHGEYEDLHLYKLLFPLQLLQSILPALREYAVKGSSSSLPRPQLRNAARLCCLNFDFCRGRLDTRKHERRTLTQCVRWVTDLNRKLMLSIWSICPLSNIYQQGTAHQTQMWLPCHDDSHSMLGTKGSIARIMMRAQKHAVQLWRQWCGKADV